MYINLVCAYRVVLDKRDNKHRVFGLATDNMFQNVTAKKAQYRPRDGPSRHREGSGQPGQWAHQHNGASQWAMASHPEE